jgi:plastocyanin
MRRRANLEGKMKRARYCWALPAAVLLAQAIYTTARAEEVREFYIKTVHFDGNTSIHGDADHKAEPFPEAPMPDGRGLTLNKPDDKGKWRIRAFAFEPSQIVVKAGEAVRLHFVGVQGMSHSIHVEGEGVDERFVLTRGKLHTVDFTPTKPGVIEMECYDHEPSMKGEILVLAP